MAPEDASLEAEPPEAGEEVEAALVDDHEVGADLVRLTDQPID